MSKSQNFEYVNNIGFYLCNICSIVVAQVNSFTRLTNFFTVQACLTLYIFPTLFKVSQKLSRFSKSFFFFFFQLFLPHAFDSDKVEIVSLLHLP